MKFFLTLFMLIGNFSAYAAESQTIIRLAKMFPGASIDRYNSVEDFLLSDEVRASCPEGIRKILSFTSSVDADLIVNHLNTEAQSYPEVRQKASVICN